MNIFDVKKTNICKGIAILLMILHHTIGLYYDKFNPLWYFDHSIGVLELLTVLLSSSGKVCVSIFTILSGYGICASYLKFESKRNKHIEFVFYRLLSLYFIYLSVYIIHFLIEFHSINDFIIFYSSTGLTGNYILNFIFDVIGLSALWEYGIVNVTWYFRAICIIYFLSPYLIELVKKYQVKPIFLLFICEYSYLILFNYNKNDIYYFYLLEFFVGIYLFISDKLNDLVNRKSLKQGLIYLLLYISFLLRIIFGDLFDLILALCIVLTVAITKKNFISGILLVFGKYSSYMWLSHGMVIHYIKNYSIQDNCLRFALVVLISFTLAKIMDCINRFFSKYVKKLHKYI